MKLKWCFFAHVQAPSKISADIADVDALESELRRVPGACARVWDERERERLYICSSKYLCVYVYIYIHMYITYMCKYMWLYVFMIENVCIHEYVYVSRTRAPSLYVCMYIYTHVYTFMYM